MIVLFAGGLAWWPWRKNRPRIWDWKDNVLDIWGPFNGPSPTCSLPNVLANVVLFGDPGSNKWIAKMNGNLPFKWTRESVTLGGQTFPSPESFPALNYRISNPRAALPWRLRCREARFVRLFVSKVR